MQLLFGTLIILLLRAADGEMRSYDKYVILETSNVTDEQSKLLMQEGRRYLWDFWKLPMRDGNATIFLSPEQFPEAEDTLKKLRISYEIGKKDTKSILRIGEDLLGPIAPGTSISFNHFYNLQGIHSYLDEMARRYPSLVTVLSAGRSTENRDLKYVKISDGSGGASAKCIIIDAGMHARERIGPSTALYVIHQLVEKYDTNKELLQGLEWYIMPVVNPDGFEYASKHDKFWRKTRSINANSLCMGTDINRNFDFHWGEWGSETNTCAESYVGPYAESEPETRALKKLVLDLHPRVALYLNLHSFGELLLYPYGHTWEYAKDYDDLLKLGKAAMEAVRKVNGTVYAVGAVTELIYIAPGCALDWFKDVGGIKYTYAMELPSKGRFFHPLGSDILPIVTETFEGVRVMGNFIRGTGQAG